MKMILMNFINTFTCTDIKITHNFTLMVLENQLKNIFLRLALTITIDLNTMVPCM